MQKDLLAIRKYIFVKDYKVIYLGRINNLSLHSHITWSLCICIEGEFFLRSKLFTGTVSNSILIPPGIDHEIESNDSLVLVVFFEKFLKSENLNTNSFQISPLSMEIVNEWRNKLIPISILSYNEIDQVMNILLRDLKLHLNTFSMNQLDGRIKMILSRLNTSLDERLRIEDLAKSVDLSTSRISHLFKSQMGVSIATCRIWLKLRNLSQSLKLGKNLTYAAQESGFFDSSHFNRVFKRYFGLAPHKVFSNGEIIWFT